MTEHFCVQLTGKSERSCKEHEDGESGDKNDDERLDKQC